MPDMTETDDDPVPSPCVSVCRLDATGQTCAGCGRTLEEIRRWTRMSPTEQRAVWHRLGQRPDAPANT
jgi:predicted Fe-S protein YdhL (DUF1289 family)